MRYLEHLAIQEAYDIRQREYTPPFAAMFGLAVSVHILMLLVWSLLPEKYLIQVPLHSLNVQLGGGSEVADTGGQQAPPLTAKERRKDTETQQAVTQKTVAAKPKPKRKKPATPPTPVTVRTPSVLRSPAHVAAGAAGSLSPGAGAGQTYGNAAQSRLIVERYTRQISLQVQTQASSIHLTEQLKAKTAGERVVVELLLVIARNGLLNRYSVTRSSGFAELDQAAIRAVHDAAPFPSPPLEYAGYGFKVAVFMD